MKFYLAAIAVGIISCASTANAQSCLNYWINPDTGAEECLNDWKLPTTVRANSGYSGSNFSTGSFTIKADPEDPDGVAIVKGSILNISKEALEIDTVEVNLSQGNKILKNIKIEVGVTLAPGQSALLVGHALREELDKVPLAQIQITPAAVNYR